ncbi:MAG TPA: ClpX C4-type zinc finger protein [Myxococcales bacterium]|jgi:hypothetical protein|nr:ClpX C4-type zinc finger protein [Myxococcales bacterium]
MELTRRRFMYLVGLAAPGIYVTGSTGFLTPPPALAAEPGGACSFCGRAGHLTSGLIGGAVEGELGASARICAGCVRMCRDIVSEMDRVAAEAGGGGSLKMPRLAGSPNVVEQELEQILTQAATDYGLTAPEVERLLENSRALIDGATNVPASQVAHHFDTPTCSFCQADQRAARRLIAAPRAFICDKCVASAASLLPVGRA